MGLVLVVRGTRDLRGGAERGQTAFLSSAGEHLDVEVCERQHRTHAVLLAEALERRDVAGVLDQRHGGAHVGGVLSGSERRGIRHHGLGQVGKAGDDVIALAHAREQHGGRTHSSPSQPPAAPL